MNKHPLGGAPRPWTDADAVRSIELQLNALSVGARVAFDVAKVFEEAAAGLYPIDDLSRFVRQAMGRLLETAEEAKRDAALSGAGPMSATRHRA